MPGRAESEFEGDTSREALRVQYAALRRMTVAERLAMVDALTHLARTMAREGLKRRHPQASEAEIDDLFAELVLGKEMATAVRAHRNARSERRAP